MSRSKPHHLSLLFAAGLASACSTVTVEGDLDGSTPEVTEAIYYEIGGDELDYFRLFITNVDDSCSVLADYIREMNRLWDELDDAQTEAEILLLAEDMNDEEEMLPQELWEISMTLSTSNHSESTNSDRSFDGIEADESIDDPGEFRMSARHMTDHFDWVKLFEYAMEDRDSFDPNGDFFEANRGNANTGTYDSRSELAVTADASFKDYDLLEGELGGGAGSLEIDVTATYCSEIEDIVE